MRKKLRQRAAGGLLSVFFAAGILGGCTSTPQSAIVSSTSSTQATEETTDTGQTDSTELEVEEALYQVPTFSAARYPRVDGSTATLPLSIALYQQSTGASEEEAQVAIEHSKTDNSYYNLLYNTADLLLVYEASQEVKDELKAQGDPFLIEPIGKDALVFLMNQGNPVESLTEEQIVDIYSGNIKEWSQVGGMNLPIEAFQRPERSGSQTMMEKLVMKGRQMDQAPTVKVLDSMGDLIEGVASYDNRENALGYSVYFYAKNMYERPELKFMSVNNVMPSNSTIKSGKYPYVNEFYAVIRKDEPENSPARLLFDWLTTEDGQLFVEVLGYVGVKDISSTETLKPEIKMPEMAQGSFQLSLKDHERIIMAGDTIMGYPSKVIMLDRDFNEESLPEGVTMARNLIRQVDINDPLIMSDSHSGLNGIYSLKEKKWVIQPEYASLYFDERNNCYRGYEEDWNTQVWIDKNLSQIHRGTAYLMQGYLWEPKNKWQYDISTIDGKFVKSMDFTGGKEYYHSYEYFGYMVMDYQNEFEIYGPDGSLVFDKGYLPPEYQDTRIILSDISGDGKCITIYSLAEGGNQTILFILENHKLFLLSEDDEQVRWKGDEWYFKKDGLCYDTDGNQRFTASGHPATTIVGHGWSGYEPEKGEYVLENGNGSKAYTLKHSFETIAYVDVLPGDYFILTDKNGYFAMYHKDQDVLRGAYIYTWERDGYTIISYQEKNEGDQKDMHNLLLSKTGQLVYQTMAGEEILGAGKDYVITERGNYIYMLDWDGNSVFSMLQGEMGND